MFVLNFWKDVILYENMFSYAKETKYWKAKTVLKRTFANNNNNKKGLESILGNTNAKQSLLEACKTKGGSELFIVFES